MDRYVIIALVAVALVITVPIVISGATQPSIIINLEPDQDLVGGSKALQIKDENGTEVFSVLADGSMKSTNIISFHFEQAELITVTEPQVSPFSDLEVLAVWEVVRDPSLNSEGLIFTTLIVDSIVYGQMNPTSTGCGCGDTGWYRSSDSTFSVEPNGTSKMVWNSMVTMSAQGTSGVFSPELDNESLNTFSSVNFIAFGSQLPFSGQGSVQIKEMEGGLTVHFTMDVIDIKRVF